MTTTATKADEFVTTLRGHHKTVAVYSRHQDAEEAVKGLQEAGFDMSKLSIVGRDYHTEEHVVGFYNTGDRMKYWGKLGAFWGGLLGVLFAPAFFIIPGVGPVLTGGFLGSALMGMLEGGAVGAATTGGLTALGAALLGIGVPRDSVLRYERALKADKFLLAVRGTEAEARRAREILSGKAEEVSVHEPV